MLDGRVGRGSTPRLRIPCLGGYRFGDESAGLCPARSRGVTGVSFTQTEAISLMQTRSKGLELTNVHPFVTEQLVWRNTPPYASR